MRSEPEQIFVHAIQHQLALLIVHRRAHHHDARRALRDEFDNLKRGMQRVAGIDRFEELRIDLDEADQAFAGDMGKSPAPAAVNAST